MKLGYEYLEELLIKKGKTLSDLASLLKITPQSIQTWKASKSIPAKRVSQITDFFNLDPYSVDCLLGIQPLSVSYRTRRGEHKAEINVSETNAIRSQVLFERFFSDFESTEHSYDLSELRSKILESKDNFLNVAQCIRDAFTIPNYKPFGVEALRGLQQRIGVRSLYMPFAQIGLRSTRAEDSDQTALLYSKANNYFVLIDSDRTIDEAHFDKTHEVLHAIFDQIANELGGDLEKLIDHVSGDLIYPRNFIVEQFFRGDETSRPIKNKDFIVRKFLEITQDETFILSPRGLARAMRDAGLTTPGSELFNFLHSEFHETYRKTSLTYSRFGEMDFQFSDRAKLVEFYINVVDRQENAGHYPIFTKLRDDLISGALPPSDFADTLGLEHHDALVLKEFWSQKSNNI